MLSGYLNWYRHMKNSKINSILIWVLFAILILSIIGSFVASWFGYQPLVEPIFAVIVALISGLITMVFFNQKQALDEVSFFRELFQEYNKRYDQMNSFLYQIYSKGTNKGLSVDDVLHLYDYFNL